MVAGAALATRCCRLGIEDIGRGGDYDGRSDVGADDDSDGCGGRGGGGGFISNSCGSGDCAAVAVMPVDG
jgi:hypothetical protein